MKKFRIFTLLLAVVYVTFVLSNESYTFTDATKLVRYLRSDYQFIAHDSFGIGSVDQVPDGVGGGGYMGKQSLAIYVSPDLFTLSTLLVVLACLAWHAAWYTVYGLCALAPNVIAPAQRCFQSFRGTHSNGDTVKMLFLLAGLTASFVWPTLLTSAIVFAMYVCFEWQPRAWLKPALAQIKELRSQLKGQ